LRCTQYAPDVFEVDEYGHAFVDLPEVDAKYQEATRRALENCPERAITITEE
jgi:ferredoxin